ncbi:hypothetical protein LWI29_032208 [Acer saccharum]|uniref:Uncharacterized protein n=1 Tax=Acer saccharum TaxID=4024 RepID=A0AA39T8A8_ACESA|nr:hypothetical protein LWI29_032208 [Acer saccharum]
MPERRLSKDPDEMFRTEANPTPTNDPTVEPKLFIDINKAKRVPSIPGGNSCPDKIKNGMSLQPVKYDELLLTGLALCTSICFVDFVGPVTDASLTFVPTGTEMGKSFKLDQLIITHHTRLSQLGQRLISKPVVGSIVHAVPDGGDQVRQSLLAFPRRLRQLHLDAGLIHGNGGHLRYLQHLSTLKLCL